MKTDFFQNIADLNIPGLWKIVIQTDENGQFTVSELFTASCGDKAIHKVIPMNFNGTAEELGEGFFTAITAPVTQTAGLISNMEEHLKSIELAKLASKIEQDRKAKEKAQSAATAKTSENFELPKISKEEKKRAYDEAMKQVGELIQKLKFSEALAILPPAEDYPAYKTEIIKKSEYLKKQASLYEKALINFNAE